MGLRWVATETPRAKEVALECWLPAGSGVPGGHLAATTATALLAVVRARVPAQSRAEVEVTTTYTRFSVEVPVALTAQTATALMDALLAAPSSASGAPPPRPRWLHESGMGPWLAEPEADAPTDVLAFHRLHYRPGAMVLVVDGHPAPDDVRHTLATHMARGADATPEAPAGVPRDGGVAAPEQAATAAASAAAEPRWARIAMQGPSPDAWPETAALALLGEVLASRLNLAMQRPVYASLEVAPGKTWLLLAIEDPPAAAADTIATQLAALRDDTVDLAELEPARARARGALGEAGLAPAARRRAAGREALLGLPGASRLTDAALTLVGRAEVQVAAQRFGCGASVRITTPAP
jgi:hypothetical protein